MKKYNVEAIDVTPAMIEGKEPWSSISMSVLNEITEAENAEEAINFVKDTLFSECGYEPADGDDDLYLHCDDYGDVDCGWRGFKATEVTATPKKIYASWEDVVNDLNPDEFSSLRLTLDNYYNPALFNKDGSISSEEVAKFTDEYVAEQTGRLNYKPYTAIVGPSGDPLPDVVNGKVLCTKANFLWIWNC